MSHQNMDQLKNNLSFKNGMMVVVNGIFFGQLGNKVTDTEWKIYLQDNSIIIETEEHLQSAKSLVMSNSSQNKISDFHDVIPNDDENLLVKNLENEKSCKFFLIYQSKFFVFFF